MRETSASLANSVSGTQPQTGQLHRLIVAEPPKFLEFATAVAQASGRQEVEKLIGRLVMHRAPNTSADAADSRFAALKFLQILMSLPHWRAESFGTPMTLSELVEWLQHSVRLFLNVWNGMGSQLASVKAN